MYQDYLLLDRIDSVKLASNVFARDVLRMDDPYLSDLIPPPDVLGDEDTIRIPEAIGEILRDEWDAYMELRTILSSPAILLFDTDNQLTLKPHRINRIPNKAMRSHTIMAWEQALRGN
jgi:hypothetical protein